ncbi:ribonuclease PH [Parvularcula bermudensis HTCC2503]|uniref:Ribonuclease PH n=1 Tax=Parvularcula bermudensis (strain ATCC BAA-594 / HTCC2503 / KCTC 12087) TaxID=314260 RepID=E0TEN0_PARBH|nr:ribonuclease PH [Parvularcula bermudensis]ADM08913.1 ribonuclease PH [Parvularcula bermudensis HTCC2503]
MRPSGRAFNEMRDVTFELGVNRYAEGSCLVRFGNTHVLCTASFEENVPPWLKNQRRGWVTAEYSMLPRATHTRGRRERDKGPSGRTQEIQRLIGRSLRAVVDLNALGERQIQVDCDVLQADGGTRTASITGGYVALKQAIDWALSAGVLTTSPLTDSVAAISCGLYNRAPVVDLDYDEDSTAQADANFVFTGTGGIVEIQATAEGDPFADDEFAALVSLAKAACQELSEKQKSL